MNEYPVQRNRRVKTYARRASRITKAQRRALVELLPVYGIGDSSEPLDLAGMFPNAEKFCVEVGFGDGEALAAMASANPRNVYLGIEVYRSGIGRCLRRLNQAGLENVRVSSADVRDVLERFATESIHEICVFFPDPWSKRRHHKRRLIQPDFIDLCAGKLTPGGVICMATDSLQYAQHMLEVLTENGEIRNFSDDGGFCDGNPNRPQTQFERKALECGSAVYDLIFVRREPC